MRFLIFAMALTLVGCGSGSGSTDLSSSRIQQIHKPLILVDEDGVPMSSKPGAMAITLGSIWLETQIGSLTAAGGTIPLQASETASNGVNIYTAYNAIDDTTTKPTTIRKVGAVEHFRPYNCDTLATLLHTEICLGVQARFDFAATDMFDLVADGTNVFAVGSTSDESLGDTARLYKLDLNANKSPVSINTTKVLPSIAGTGVGFLGANLIATSGTSTNLANMGGVTFMNKTTLVTNNTKSLYDARSVAIPSGNPSTIFVTLGRDFTANLPAGNPAKIIEYNADGSNAAISSISNAGNTIPESHSTVHVGNTLILASLGDGGFSVYCRATGVQLANIPKQTVAGIPAGNTVTNSVIATPGYIFVANGEAGVYVYSFNKSSAGNTSYCQGVTLGFQGRLKLDSDNNDNTYQNGELSANGLTQVYGASLLGLASQRYVIVSSGNKGVSLLNLSDITLLGTAVDDFP